MKRERVVYYDSVAGILLVHMVLFHCCQWAHVYDRLQIVLFFFMTWFFFKNGLFYRVRSFKEEVYQSFKRLIVPFIIFSILGTIILWIKYLIEGNLTIHSMISSVSSILVVGAPKGNLPLWFLLSLFSVRVIYSLAFNHLRTRVLQGG
jgi:fucose 4-O-acetylase-like acetyltransferase